MKKPCVFAVTSAHLFRRQSEQWLVRNARSRFVVCDSCFEEQMMLARRIVERARKSNHLNAVHTFEQRAREAEADSSAIRRMLLSDKKGDIAEQTTTQRD